MNSTVTRERNDAARRYKRAAAPQLIRSLSCSTGGNKAADSCGSGADVHGNLPDAGRTMKAAPQAGFAQNTLHVSGAMGKEAEAAALEPEREVDVIANQPGEPRVARVDEAIQPA